MLERIRNILSKYTKSDNISTESILSTDLDLTSFDLVNIVADFEDEFDIEISDRDISTFVTVADIIAYLKIYAKK